MKTRMGFVSNSSSSSFIVGIAEIKDEEKFNSYIEKQGIRLGNYDAQVIELGEELGWNINVSGNKVTLESFQTSASAPISNPTGKFLVVDVRNGEGDHAFWNEDYCEMEYDIDLSFFSEEQQKLYQIFHDPNSGLLEGEVSYGAGRDG